MKMGICNELFQGWPIEKVFDYTARLGFDGVEIAPFTLADSVLDLSTPRRREIRRAAEENGIEILGLHWLLVKPEGLYINHPDAAVRKRTQEYMRALIHFCADLGGKILTHGSPRQRTVQEGWNFAEAWKHARETFEACMDAARARDVTYCIEPLTRSNTNFINTVDEAFRLVEEINHPHFQMMVDCRSTETNEGNIAQALLRAQRSGHLRHVHANDVNGKGPGFGRVQFTPVLSTLLEIGYRGYISVEVFEFDPDPQTIASRSLGYLKGILETLNWQP